MRAALEKCVNIASSLMDRDPHGILSLTEGLILSGIAMSLQKFRPASGLEHYFSHIFDMSKLEKGNTRFTTWHTGRYRSGSHPASI